MISGAKGMEFHPVTRDRWDDLVHLFKLHGNPGYCWCMYWRLSSQTYAACDSPGRRSALEKRVSKGEPVGILAYQAGVPVAWCSVAPRETYGRLERSRTIRRVDDRTAWSIVCFYLERSVRGQHLTLDLIRAAVDYARSQGAEVVEAYPVEPKTGEQGDLDYNVLYRHMGFASTFVKAGFQDVTPPSSKRRVMRYSEEVENGS